MDVLDIATLKKIIEKVPEDYEIEFDVEIVLTKFQTKLKLMWVRKN